MQVVHAAFKNDVFRPTQPVELPESCLVAFEPRPIHDADSEWAARDAVIAVLPQRFASGERDVAARHDEHRP